jgi:hypothetical protein
MIMQRLIGLVLAAALASCSNSSGERSAATSEGSTLEGVVREAGTEVPIAGVSVFLVRTSDRPQIRTNTDADGRFVLQGLEPGRHLVALIRDGYVVPGRLEIAGYPFTVTAGRNVGNVVMHLIPAGTVSGRVLNDDGAPANRVEVQFLQNLYVMGRRQWSIVNRSGSSRSDRVETNARGEFRALGVDPGQYAIRLVPHEATIDAIVPGGLSPAPALYPGVRDISKAALVEVRAGRETLLDEVKLVKERRGWIRVTVFNETGHALEGFGDWRVEPVGWIGSDFPLVEQRVVNNFHEIQPDSPGVYNILAMWRSPAGPLAGKLRVSFQGSDQNLRLTLQKPLGKLIGRVVLEDQGGVTQPLSGVEVSIGPEITYFARSGPDGTFTLPAVYAGDYKLGAIRGLPDDAFVFRVSQGPRDVLSQDLRIENRESVLDVVIRSGAGTAEGKVLDSSMKPVHNALVSLVPEPPLSDRTDYYGAYHDVHTDQDGAFTLRGLTPGSYQAYAWADAPAGGFRNAEFMKTFAGKGTAVLVERGGRANLSLKALD